MYSPAPGRLQEAQENLKMHPAHLKSTGLLTLLPYRSPLRRMAPSRIDRENDLTPTFHYQISNQHEKHKIYSGAAYLFPSVCRSKCTKLQW